MLKPSTGWLICKSYGYITYIRTRYFPGYGCEYGYSPNTRPVPNLTNITRVWDLHQTQFDFYTQVLYSTQTQLDLKTRVWELTQTQLDLNTWVSYST